MASEDGENQRLHLVRYVCVRCDLVEVRRSDEPYTFCIRCSAKIPAQDDPSLEKTRVAAGTDLMFPGTDFSASGSGSKPMDIDNQGKAIPPPAPGMESGGIQPATEEMFPETAFLANVFPPEAVAVDERSESIPPQDDLDTEKQERHPETKEMFPSAAFPAIVSPPEVENRGDHQREITPQGVPIREIRRATDQMFPSTPFVTVVPSPEAAGIDHSSESIPPGMELRQLTCPNCGDVRTIWEIDDLSGSVTCVHCNAPIPVPQLLAVNEPPAPPVELPAGLANPPDEESPDAIIIDTDEVDSILSAREQAKQEAAVEPPPAIEQASEPPVSSESPVTPIPLVAPARPAVSPQSDYCGVVPARPAVSPQSDYCGVAPPEVQEESVGDDEALCQQVTAALRKAFGPPTAVPSQLVLGEGRDEGTALLGVPEAEADGDEAPEAPEEVTAEVKISEALLQSLGEPLVVEPEVEQLALIHSSPAGVVAFLPKVDVSALRAPTQPIIPVVFPDPVLAVAEVPKSVEVVEVVPLVAERIPEALVALEAPASSEFPVSFESPESLVTRVAPVPPVTPSDEAVEEEVPVPELPPPAVVEAVENETGEEEVPSPELPPPWIVESPESLVTPVAPARPEPETQSSGSGVPPVTPSDEAVEEEVPVPELPPLVVVQAVEDAAVEEEVPAPELPPLAIVEVDAEQAAQEEVSMPELPLSAVVLADEDEDVAMEPRGYPLLPYLAVVIGICAVMGTVTYYLAQYFK